VEDLPPVGLDRNTDKAARDRIVRLFQFVAAYHEQRNPAIRQVSDHEWMLAFAEVPDYEAIDLVRRVDEALGADDTPPQAEGASEDGILLRSRRPTLTDAPKASSVLDGWLGREWQDCTSTPAAIETRNQRDASGNSVVVRFSDDSARLEALAKYRSQWEEWAKNECIAVTAARIFEQLYELHGTLGRDGERYELLVADGLLVWGRQDGGVRHPLLFRTARLDFNPVIPEFCIVETGATTEFYASLFRSMPDVDGQVIGRMRTEVESLDPHPLGSSDTDGFLRSVASMLSSQGDFIGTGAAGPERDHPVVSRAPAFILRRRTSGIARAIDFVVQDAENGGELSRALHNVVGIAEESESIELLATTGDPEGSGAGVLDENTDENVLFTKLANANQLEIAHRLERESCVLVQGPPGTGKTHTIANLIGHLLGMCRGSDRLSGQRR
jgi:hypothetical protein